MMIEGAGGEGVGKGLTQVWGVSASVTRPETYGSSCFRPTEWTKAREGHFNRGPDSTLSLGLTPQLPSPGLTCDCPRYFLH